MEQQMFILCYNTFVSHGVFISLQLFERVVSVLDPDMCVNSTSALPTPEEDHAEGEGNCKEPRKAEEEKTKNNEMQVYWQCGGTVTYYFDTSYKYLTMENKSKYT